MTLSNEVSISLHVIERNSVYITDVNCNFFPVGSTEHEFELIAMLMTSLVKHLQERLEYSEEEIKSMLEFALKQTPMPEGTVH